MLYVFVKCFQEKEIKAIFDASERSVTITIIPSFIFDHIMKRLVSDFLYSSVICDIRSWLFDCLLVCYLIVAVTALNVVSFSIQMLVRCWLVLSEQSVTSSQLTVSWYQWIDLSNCGLSVSCWSCLPLNTVIHYDRTLPVHKVISFKCFDIVGWASGRASGLSKMSDEVLA